MNKCSIYELGDGGGTRDILVIDPLEVAATGGGAGREEERDEVEDE